ncbi:4-fold beta flower protein [Demequina activiva]|uniref:4-fold beta flower protein n=1 Tax=Demequina activiva TaxID=1582364 RepID=UPI00357138ED
MATASYSLRGQHVGHFVSGSFRDARGAVVGFLAGASGEPPKPARPARAARPARPVRCARIARPARSTSWSALNFDAYVSGAW